MIARGLPKTPVGELKTTFWAVSGAPGLLSLKEVIRSGWPPAWGVETTTWVAVAVGPEMVPVTPTSSPGTMSARVGVEVSSGSGWALP